MTKLCYDGQRWSADYIVFGYARKSYGPGAVWHGQTFGGTSAFALLGPDIAAPGGTTHNPPQAKGPGWDQAWTHAALGGPAYHFTNDPNHIAWKRGHLLNAEWGGSGTLWSNLVALTAQANANHATVEGHVRTLLTRFRQFDMSNHGRNAYWYCIGYWVQAATLPWSAGNLADDLYSYCPNMIRVTWRVMRMTKPTGAPGTTFGSHLTATQGHIRNAVWGTPACRSATAPDLANDGIILPGAPPPVLTNSLANQNEAGGVTHPVAPGAPAPGVAGPHDGTVEIFQN
ncbi:hypothetical protein [Tateyamaria sp. SN6-1]|uniref:hypothetical protein n=1 Tax=Tateyamaria sp. SN6-1 TaxID=3092148 RepID=UPI0039F5745E